MNRALAARCTAWPPATEPVKLTKPIRGSAISRSLASWVRCRTWNTPAGSPAASKAAAKRSAHSGVWCECFSTTALPAINAGTMPFTAVR